MDETDRRDTEAIEGSHDRDAAAAARGNLDVRASLTDAKRFVRPRPVAARSFLLMLLVCLVAGATAGCKRDTDLAEAVYTVESAGVSARVWIPINEPRSVGTYRAEIFWPGGTKDRVEVERDGMIGNVWLVDLTGDELPELVVATSSAGSGSYGDVHVYERRGDSLAPVPVKLLKEWQRAGYMGHDVFSTDGGLLRRSFPVYLEGDANAEPTGGEAVFWYSFADSAWIETGGHEDGEDGDPSRSTRPVQPTDS
jgi:hypothetical protein